MSRRIARLQRGVLAGLALLFAWPLLADDALRQAIRKEMRDESYVLIEDQSGARLYVLSPGERSYSVEYPTHSPGSASAALAKTLSDDARQRALGLVELSGDPGHEALSAALALLSDPAEIVREEAVQLALGHPGADRTSVIAIALSDSSPRVRDAALDILEDDAQGDGDEDVRRPR